MTTTAVPSAGWRTVYAALDCSPRIDERSTWEVLGR